MVNKILATTQEKEKEKEKETVEQPDKAEAPKREEKPRPVEKPKSVEKPKLTLKSRNSTNHMPRALTNNQQRIRSANTVSQVNHPVQFKFENQDIKEENQEVPKDTVEGEQEEDDEVDPKLENDVVQFKPVKPEDFWNKVFLPEDIVPLGQEEHEEEEDEDDDDDKDDKTEEKTEDKDEKDDSTSSIEETDDDKSAEKPNDNKQEAVKASGRTNEGKDEIGQIIVPVMSQTENENPVDTYHQQVMQTYMKFITGQLFGQGEFSKLNKLEDAEKQVNQ